MRAALAAVGDGENDADSDFVCGDVDSCAGDAENDADSDAVCGNNDACPYDAENDAYMLGAQFVYDDENVWDDE